MMKKLSEEEKRIENERIADLREPSLFENNPVSVEVITPKSAVSTPERALKVVPALSDAERSKRLGAAEDGIKQAIEEHKHAWVRMYYLMDEVRVNELWKARKRYHSWSAWVADLAGKFGVEKRQLDDAYAAGDFYNQVVAATHEVDIPALDKTPAAISPVTVRDCEKWSRSQSLEATAAMLQKIANGDIKRKEMSQLWKQEKASGRAVTYKSRHERDALKNQQSADVDPDPNRITLTADMIKQIIKTDPSWLPRPPVQAGYEVLNYADKKHYAAFDEFRVNVGKSRPDRIDSVAFNVYETVSEPTGADQYNLVIHGIEIKVSPYDLVRDQKVTDYAPYCDYLWFCLPDTAEMREAVKQKLEDMSGIGVLLVNQSTYQITRWIDPVPLSGQGTRRAQALSVGIMKLIDQKKVITPRLEPPASSSADNDG
jgi:hypothetical protein